jgi:uncharacterized protein (DUF488 family)
MDDTHSRIFTVGYGSRSIEDFISLLRSRRIDSLIDVRTYPYSRFQPAFSIDPLKSVLSKAGVRYAFMGESLGGRPDDPSCYVDGRVDYGLCRERPIYKDAIERIRRAVSARPGLALMCSEARPQDCHRAKLIGASLADLGIEVIHLDESGSERTQDDVLMMAVANQPSLFGAEFLHSRKRYRSPND